MVLRLDMPGLNEFPYCKKAFEELEQIALQESPDKARVISLVKYLQDNKNGTEWVMLEDEKRFSFLQHKIDYILRDELASAEEERNKVQVKSLPVGYCDGYVEGNWNSCISQLKGRSLEIATARQIAELRISAGKNSNYCTKGCWVAENFNYLPDGNILVASRDYNPLLKNAEEATKAHIRDDEFWLGSEMVEALMVGIKQGKVLLLKRSEISDKISTDAFGKEPLTAFLGWNQDYGKFLNECGIKKISSFVAEESYAKKQAFSRALWASYLNFNSALNGNSDLDYSSGRAFGVRSASPVGRSGLRSGADAERQNRGERSELGDADKYKLIITYPEKPIGGF